MPVAQSALHELHRARGARMETRGAWEIPAQYGPVEAELDAARSAVAVGERCGVGVFDLVGAGVPEVAGHLAVAGVPVGAAAPVALAGAGDARWYRLTRDHARIVADENTVLGARRSALGEGETVSLASWLAGAMVGAERQAPSAERCLHITDVSSGLTTLMIAGPRAPDLLARLVRVDLDPRAYADRRLALTGAIGVPLQIVRWDRGPLLVYELTAGRDVAEYLADALLHAGADLGLQLIGADARERLTAHRSPLSVKAGPAPTESGER
jgi:glycine cleavage system aminomethyltransferase T